MPEVDVAFVAAELVERCQARQARSIGQVDPHLPEGLGFRVQGSGFRV